MTQPERSEVDWRLLFAVDCALRQLEHALPPWVRITLEVDQLSGDPLVLEYSSWMPEELLLNFIRTAAPQTRDEKDWADEGKFLHDPTDGR